ncbi:aminotransferase class I/II-fold pyridoxal phosphate-dependent enzyme [Nocardia cyriacigeorgica]|uniref:pyridoxal phosphate-dependent aminotransferase n=1 Tax=Nocardia cyriacigeorgica TaxID=135487 RepID=UPI0013B7716F|nr:aminotransferase class I/II-fold pyridoxal phosphate-dependent enzyme [Nocardia cyriacigeorgica]NEW49594.1 aminotransferase class I/II-fold pyridoxal phosphate-dependent enzyme [Nocardia cyriacigeorgica]
MSIQVADRSRSSRRCHTAAPSVRFDLSLSENPFPPLPSVRAAIQRELGRANRYPEFLPARLPSVVAGQLGVRPDQVVVGSGATGVAMQILHTLAGPGADMVLGMPTFDGYPIMAGMTGVDVVGVPLDAAGDQDLRAMARAVSSRTRLVVLCRPHNPTGTLVSKRDLRSFLRAIPTSVPVILDEAYVEFLPANDRIDSSTLLARHPNLLILRTFSKAYGLAGLRIGYAIGNTELITRIRHLQLPFGTPTFAVTAVSASYAAEPELAVRVARITEERESLREALRHMGIEVPYSYANFLYLPGPGVATALRRAGIGARAYPDGSVRVAVGDVEAGRAVLDAVRMRARSL